MNRTTVRPPQEGRLGFTLVELLVVIGIIAVLIGILLPSLAKARKSANDAACKSNLRQIVMGMLMYANDNKGALPNYAYATDSVGDIANYVTPADPSDPLAPNPGLWTEAIHKYLSVSPRTPSMGTPNNYYLSATFLRCPEAPEMSASNDWFFTYGVNRGITQSTSTSTRKPGVFELCQIAGTPVKYMGSRKLTAVKSTEFLICDIINSYHAAPPYAYNNQYQTLNTDTDGDGILDSNSSTMTANAPYGKYNYVDFRHGKSLLNYAAADGSVQSCGKKTWFNNEGFLWNTP